MRTETAKTSEDVGYYKSPSRPAILNVRTNTDFKRRLSNLARLWKTVAEARGDFAATIDVAHVVKRLLEEGLDGAFSEFGPEPETDADWVVLEKAVKEKYRHSK